MANESLYNAKLAKKNEFYTQYEDIEREINYYVEFNNDVFRNKTILCPCDDPEWSNFTKYFAANFERFGLKKLICTSYARSFGNQQLSLFELNSPKFNNTKHYANGKLFVLEKDSNFSGKIDHNDIDFEYLKGDGDFLSEEVSKLCDEADIIVTNPPFSLFREFIGWVMKRNKQFIVIGNLNSLTDLDIFPLFMENKIWVGNAFNVTLKFAMDETYESDTNERDELGRKIGKVPSICWYTNVELEKRHEKLQLMSMKDNLRYNKKLIKKCTYDFKKLEYPYYDNYDAIEVPFSDAIPSDYDGLMGVPVTFLGNYNPEQFEIVGTVSASTNEGSLNSGKKYNEYIGYKQDGTKNGRTGSTFGKCPVIVKDDGKHPYYEKDGVRVQATYPRIFIRHKKGNV